jgi:hypothetical protein
MNDENMLDAVFRIQDWIRISIRSVDQGLDPGGHNMTHKNRKKLRNFILC